jgi:serine/threonine protein kinase
MNEGRSPTAQLEQGVRIGDFEIEKRLGAGGMGIVYQARQVSLDRRVALKVLGPALTRPSDLARFQREAQAAAKLRHPGIAAIHFLGQDGDLCYHVMELVDGISLQRVIERLTGASDVQATPDTALESEYAALAAAPAVRFDQATESATATNADVDTGRSDSDGTAISSPGLSPAARKTRSGAGYVRRCSEIARDAARALAAAHAEGVIHRDIKPGNLMLTRDRRVCIIDFGLARFFDDVSVTHSGHLVGTPMYMSPEQVAGRVEVDHRTDVYSLGLVLYELLALRRPFDSSSREALLRNIITKPLPPLAGRNSAVSKDLEAVVHKATHKDPEERYQSAGEFAEDLQRILDGKPVAAPHYRYRLDLQDLVAQRPGGVVLAAFNSMMFGVTSFAILAGMSLMMGFMQQFGAMFLMQFSIGVAVLAVGVFLGRGLLAGGKGMRRATAALASLLTLASLLGMAALVFSFVSSSYGATAQDGSNFDARGMMRGMVAMYMVPLALVLICAATTTYCLLKRDTKVWFKLAAQTRKEHDELMRSLAN